MSSGTNDVLVANKSFCSLPVQRRRVHRTRVPDYKKIHARPLMSLRNSANVRDFPVCGAFYFFHPGFRIRPESSRSYEHVPFSRHVTVQFNHLSVRRSTPFTPDNDGDRFTGKGVCVCVCAMSGINWSVRF